MTTRSEATLAARPLTSTVGRLPRTVVADPPWWPSLHRNTVGRREGPYRAGPQQTLTWCKPGYGTGQFQSNSEQILVCRKGGPTGNAFGKTGGTWFEWPRGRHSQKPEAFYDLVERVSPGPYHEMFARRVREGWTAMGNEVTGVFETPNAELCGERSESERAPG